MPYNFFQKNRIDMKLEYLGGEEYKYKSINKK